MFKVGDIVFAKKDHILIKKGTKYKITNVYDEFVNIVDLKNKEKFSGVYSSRFELVKKNNKSKY